jgi:phosphatidylglycerol:prolipoprotein diacylglycerol transferase
MHPIAFKFGHLPIHWYGVMMALAFLAGLWTASRRGLHEGVPAETIIDVGPWLIIGAILGARTLYVITFWGEEFSGKPLFKTIHDVIAVWQGGLVYYGGLIGASVGYILYSRKKKLPLWKGADILAPSVALGYFFGRIGCLLNGCCYGRVCDLPWGIRFPGPDQSPPWGSPAFKQQHDDGLLAPDATKSFPVHPTQIYESLLSLGLYAGLAWLYRRKKFDGQVFATYLVSYAILRSFVEMFRGDYPRYQRFVGGWLTPAHLVSVLILASGLLLLLLLPRHTVPAAK